MSQTFKQQLVSRFELRINLRLNEFFIREAGIWKWRAIKRPLLTPEHAEKHLEIGYGPSTLDVR